MPYALTVPRKGERLFAVGNSGTGKTFLLQSLFCALDDAIVLDTKHDGEWNETHGKSIDKERVYEVAEGRFVWHVPDAYLDDPERWEVFFKWALSVGRRTIMVDEFGDICPSAQMYPRYFRRCYGRGRSRHLSMWGTTQEILRVPSFVFGGAQYRYAFHLGNPNQRKLADQYFESPIPWEELPEPSPATIRAGTAYRFVYKGPGTGLQGPLQLAT